MNHDKTNKMKKYIIMLSLLVLFIAPRVMAQTTEPVNSTATENKVAILPILFIADGNTERIDEMRYRLQNIAYLYLKAEAMELKFQSPAETNALLLRHGVTESNFREFTPKELANMLQVEYVLTGMVTQEIAGESTSGVSNRRVSGNWERKRSVQVQHSHTKQQLSTHIDLDIYNDKGEQIFSKSRRSILSETDAYKYGIHYLLKRSPLYKR